MRLVGRSFTQKEIATKLGVSRRTIEDHMAEIRARLGARTTHQAMWIYFGEAALEEPLPSPARPARDPGDGGALTPALRFEILSRDRFTCQYCGRQAPEVVLHVDHRLARARGGSNDRSNLVTACSDCNLGKGVDTSTAQPTAVISTSIDG